MTRSSDKGKQASKGVKKLSLKKETVKDLDAGPRKGKELGDDQLDAVNGGKAAVPGLGLGPASQQCLPHSALLAAGCLQTRPQCEVQTALYTCTK